MSIADHIFIDMCQDILENGVDTRGEKVRPIWQDTGESAYTIKRFAVVNRYDLRQEFPALTLRKTGIRSAFDELLWIWQKKSNNIHDLNSRIWDSWADESGSIGKAYGYQLGVKHKYKEGMMDRWIGCSMICAAIPSVVGSSPACLSIRTSMRWHCIRARIP